MRSFTHSAHIDRRPEELFAYMLDFRNAPRWRSLVRSIEVVGGEPVQRGSRLLITLDVAGRERSAISEVWSCDPPRRLGFRNTASNVTGQFEYVLQPEQDGTLITFTCDIKPHGIMWLLLPLVLRSHRTRYVDQLGRLKRAAEGHAASDKMD
jgi:hypothetical protein